MNPIEYIHPPDQAHAIAAASAAETHVIAGGTTLVDLMRLEVIQPTAVVDVTGLPLRAIAIGADGSAMLGALVTNADVADHPEISTRFPALVEALRSGASPQIRNMATVGGNLLQRTRCPYFRDVATACNKRTPGSGCSAIGGFTRSHAVLGTSVHCIATHPSDMCVALVALEAIAHVQGPTGARAIPVEQLHTLPGDHPEIESQLRPGELIVQVELPARPFAARSRYVKVRDRASFAFALASAAAALELDGETIRQARLALGGVATKPWRAPEAEAALAGKRISRDVFARAAQLAMDGAAPQPGNAFKVELARRTIVRALERAGGLA